MLCLFPQSFNKSVRKPLKYILDAGANVNARDSEGAAIIHRAVAKHVDIELIKIILHRDADVNALWKRYEHAPSAHVLGLIWENFDDILDPLDGERGSELIVYNTRDELARFLVSHGATIDAGTPANILRSALQCCSPETFELLLTTWSGKEAVDEVLFSIHEYLEDPDPWLTARKPKDTRKALPFIQALVSAGASIKARNGEGETALMHAAASKPIFDALLATGADPNATDMEGRGILHRVMRGSSWFGGSGVERLRDLVQLGFDPLVVDSKGISLLHLAMAMPETEFGDSGPNSLPDKLPVIEQLVSYGSSPRARTDTGLTPLHFYFDSHDHIRRGSFKPQRDTLLPVLKALSRACEGFDINAQDHEGITPLHLAVIAPWRSAIGDAKILIENGANLEARAANGKSVLHLAALARCAALLEYIIDQAPSLVNSTDKWGRTPLFDASASGVVDSVAYLLRAGANPAYRDAKGLTPLHASVEFVEEQRRWKLNEIPEAGRRTSDSIDIGHTSHGGLSGRAPSLDILPVICN